jgi:hypothetical protein
MVNRDASTTPTWNSPGTDVAGNIVRTTPTFRTMYDESQKPWMQQRQAAWQARQGMFDESRKPIMQDRQRAWQARTSGYDESQKMWAQEGTTPQALSAAARSTTPFRPQGLTFNTMLPPLSPAAQEALRAQRAAAQAAYEQVLADVQLGRRRARSLKRQEMGNIARQAGGTGQDLRSNLGSTGLAESPGVIGPAIDYINAAAAKERANVRRGFADTVAGLRSQRAQADVARRQTLADLEAWKVNQQQQQLQTEWQKMINEYEYGGGRR